MKILLLFFFHFLMEDMCKKKFDLKISFLNISLFEWL